MKTMVALGASVVLGGAMAGSPSAAAPPSSQKFEGVKAIAAGSINPLDPAAGCDGAKQNATTKAAAAGFRGGVEWERLSVDSDCKLQTQGGRSTGYIYIFTARSTFQK